MRPIEPILVIDEGIALYSPYLSNVGDLRIEIFFSATNPSMNLINCGPKEGKLWEAVRPQSPTGTLFLFQSQLALGFYIIVLSSIDRLRRGSLTLGVLRPTNRLVVGLPYSIYPPIDLEA
jgi:hypothetical protein